ncbi:MAG TPA: 1,4-alpha-glucan branching protein GlgB [Pirellulales bacterium]|nr:1,4-alpha-glucan branching protein GlgB [Pirellulales bacterium]
MIQRSESLMPVLDPALRTAENATLLTRDDFYWFNEGTHQKLYEKLGAHCGSYRGVEGTYFAVWAPNARRVAAHVYDDPPAQYDLHPQGNSGIWSGFIPGCVHGHFYKYRVESQHGDYAIDKADPFATTNEEPPKTASIVWSLDYQWNDQAWMAERPRRNALDAPISVYEMHLGSWQRRDDGSFYGYRELAPRLIDYLRKLGFTHVEFLPVMEHPFYGSWGYQTTGYFAPTARYGAPQDFMFLVDQLHQAGFGVILDWVPSHFPNDAHGLSYFDGTHLYEHADPKQGIHPDWNSFIFNYGRNEVRSFLLSSARFWLEKYHADGLRVDAVASMLYLDYSRKPGQWVPNEFGGRENLAAIEFLRQLNTNMYQEAPGIQTIAEESTAWPMVSRPTYLGGLGFGLKWDMGWMHDTLAYMSEDPINRKYHHQQLTFRMMYAFNENFQLPLSHDEVVHGKGSLLAKMPGDSWQKFANLRLLYGLMFAEPGKKLLFMGSEIGPWREWDHDRSLDWSLAGEAPHHGLQRWVEDLNRTYRNEPALFEMDFDPAGFEWIDAGNVEQSIVVFGRRSKADAWIIAACNFTPVPRHNYRIGAPSGGFWRELLNSDSPEYGGSGQGNLGGVEATPVGCYGKPWSLNVVLPPLGLVLFKSPSV